MMLCFQIPTALYSSCECRSTPMSHSHTHTNNNIMRLRCYSSFTSVDEISSSTQSKANVINEDEDDENGISKIPVPRQKFIPVSKSELLDSIVFTLFNHHDEDEDEDEDAQHFMLLSSCLDSILHAEHKNTLEQMRNDYSFTTQSLSNTNSDTTNPMSFNYSLDFWNLLISPIPTPRDTVKTYINSHGESQVAVATRFQRSFMKLLQNAQFQQLSATDLDLTSALNSDYLLTLPIYVDWKRASESNAIIFRRGYATETQKGLLIVEKLDYIQSKLLQGLFSLISKPLGKLGTWITEASLSAPQTQQVRAWFKRLKLWLKQLPISQQFSRYYEQTSGDLLVEDQITERDLPIWLAAQNAVPRYEGSLSSVGPRGRLLRRLLTWIGLLPSIPEKPFKLDDDSKHSEPYLRPIFISRISLSDIWKPAMKKNCGNDIWKQLKTSISILLSQSILQEPAFQELILLYTKEERDSGDKSEVPSLQLKIYEKIPIPDLPVIFPDKKLSFRIIDAVRLDAATILGLLAFFINYKFENILSSPSAIFLDVVALSALVIYITRVVLGYKQTWDRYQLLVNRTLYEKTLASGFGSVHFLVDASEQQQYKEAILAYAILLREEKGEITCRRSVGDKCVRFLYDVLKVKVEMPIDEAIKTLSRLGLVTENHVEGKMRLQVVPCSKACQSLKERWNSLLG